MRESSIVIHKGGKEEKYELYIEDYVMSFLKEETGTLELSECYFYGMRENRGRKYILYGALRDKSLPYFERYTLLEEVGCRLTQAGPVFYVREKEGVYELKGYAVFYEDNQEMQNYLIDRRKSAKSDGSGAADKTMRQAAGKGEAGRGETAEGGAYHRAVSVQLCALLIVLVAIVINSANSYDKMNDLNRSAEEVFFAIENQEAADDVRTADSAASSADDEIKMADTASEKEDGGIKGGGQEDVEAEEAAESVPAEEKEGNLRDAAIPAETAATSGEELERREEEAAEEKEAQEDETAEEKEAQEDETEENEEEADEMEALSRNVARYYEVEKGDTLYTISRKIYGDSTYVQEICELNQIADPDQIRYGQKIVLP